MDDAQTYTWSQFTAAVNGLLPVDAARVGSVPALMSVWARLAVIELQNLIPLYRQNHETLYSPADFILEGWASRCALPPQARVRQAFMVTYNGPCQGGLGPNLVVAGLTYGNPATWTIGVVAGGTYSYIPGLSEISLTNGSQVITISGNFIAQGTVITLTGTTGLPITATVQQANTGSSVPQLNSIANVTTSIAKCTRHPLEDYAWADRMNLVNGKAAVNGGRGYICFDSQGDTFYTFPGIKDCQNISVFWDGLKIQFQPNELTPFTEQMTLVVADYVKRRIVREVDKDIPLSESFEESYMEGRTLLYLEARERQRTNP